MPHFWELYEKCRSDFKLFVVIGNHLKDYERMAVNYDGENGFILYINSSCLNFFVYFFPEAF